MTLKRTKVCLSHYSNLLATFCHESKGRLSFLVPITANVRMGEVLVSHRLDVLNVDYFSKGSGVNDLLNGLIVGRIAEHFK